MSIEQLKQDPVKTVGKTIVQMGAGALFGFAGVMLFDELVGLKWLAENTNIQQLLTFLLAGTFILIGAIVFAMSFSKKLFTYGRTTEDMDDEEFAETRPINRWSAIGLFFYAVALILLALGNPNGDAPQYGHFWGVVGCMVAQLGINWFLWKRYDELWRQVTKDACAVTFTVSEVGLFIWAGAALFGLGVTFDPLLVVVASTALFLLVSICLTVRRGMA